MKRTKTVKLTPHVESPTWGDVQRMAEVVINRLGGPAKAAEGLSAESFYALTILASLNLDEAKSKAFIFGRQYLTSDDEQRKHPRSCQCQACLPSPHAR